MKLHYYKGTDSLSIDLALASSSESSETTDGLVINFDEAGHVVGIDIQHASERTDLPEMTAEHLPLVAQVA